MELSNTILRKDEQAILSLRNLYEHYGYKKYKMSKFEEYDLYLENKSFIKSNNIITFNDHYGKLLALKPDITLSIVKNFKDSTAPERVYYNENVYRAASGSTDIKEMMQVGLEYIGNLDIYSIAEVISLAAKSLELISNKFVIGISHMGLVTGLLESTGLNYAQKAELLKLISEKNSHEISRLCAEFNVYPALTEKIIGLADIFGTFDAAIDKVRALVVSEATAAAVKELEDVYGMLEATGTAKYVVLDFSILNDMDYYNGIIFQGFIDTIANGVLFGGRYDNLVCRLGKKSQAIGFAIYLDELERYFSTEKGFDVDTIILYDDESDTVELTKAVAALTEKGESVCALKENNGAVKAARVLKFTEKELTPIG